MGGRFAIVLFLAARCGTPSDVGQDASTDAPDTPDASEAGYCAPDAGPPDAYRAPAADAGPSTYLPQVKNAGGHVMQTPTLVPITFDSDPLEPALDDFTAALGCSSYWQAVASDYGVGVPVSSPVHLSDPPPASITEQGIANFIGSAIASGTVPTPTPETIYVLYYPAGTKVTLRDGTPMCGGVPSYHEDGTVAGGSIAYAVVPRCAQAGLSAVDAVTSAASHEIVEAATDPYPTYPAYGAIDAAHVAWALVNGDEVADLCQLDSDAVFTPADLPYAVQRSWSNRAAFGAHDPCVPAAAGGYFNLFPTSLSPIQAVLPFGVVTTQGVTVPPGGQVVIDATAYADGFSGSWQTQAQDLAAVLGGPPYLDVSIDVATVSSGDTVHVTVTRADASYTNVTWGIVLVSTAGDAVRYAYALVNM